MSTTETENETILERLQRIVSEVELDMQIPCVVRIGRDEGVYDAFGEPAGKYFVQIQCFRRDVITGEEDWGYGGKEYISEHAVESEIIQTIFGLYVAYWTHEARETFRWRGRRVFGPHIKTEALWEAAPHIEVRSAKHVDDRA
jgi:hypothetical protein